MVEGEDGAEACQFLGGSSAIGYAPEWGRKSVYVCETERERERERERTQAQAVGWWLVFSAAAICPGAELHSYTTQQHSTAAGFQLQAAQRGPANTQRETPLAVHRDTQRNTPERGR